MKKIYLVMAVAAAAMAMFAVSASSASATQLCKNIPVVSCAHKNIYPQGTELTLSLKPGTEAKVTYGGTPLAACKEAGAAYKLAVESEGQASLSLTRLGFSLGSCNYPTKADFVPNAWISWKSGTSNGVVSFEGPVIETNSPFTAIPCTYTFGGQGELLGGANPTVVFNKMLGVPTKPNQTFLCGKQVHFSAEYELTSPKPLYVVQY